MKRHRNLIERVAATDNLRLALHKTSKGKRGTIGYLIFKEYDQANLGALHEEILDGAYRIGQYRHFTITEPKPRNIMALEFKDRLVQHALINVIGPIFEASFMAYSFACRVGLGTHAGVRHIQSALRKTGSRFFLKTDFRKYFPSINRPILHRMYEMKIGCRRTLDLIAEIVPREGSGIPIGSLTSQSSANIYGTPMDRFIHFVLQPLAWARYMDDIVIVGDNLDRLRRDFDRIQRFAADNLALDISRWSVSPVSRGINFLGYRIWPSHKLLRRSSVIAAKRKVRNCIEHGDTLSLQRFLASWSGHASWADSHNLITWMEYRYGISNYQFA